MKRAVSLRSLLLGAAALTLAMSACSDSSEPAPRPGAGGDDSAGEASTNAGSQSRSGAGHGGSPSDDDSGGEAGTPSEPPIDQVGGGAAGERTAGGGSANAGGRGGSAGSAGRAGSSGSAGTGGDGNGAAGDAGLAGAGGADGAIDGCDYVEKGDDTNDFKATPEETGRTLKRAVTICGKLDPGHFDGDIADADRFIVGLDDEIQDVIFKLQTEGDVGAAAVGIQFDGTWGGLVSGKAVISQTAYGQDLQIIVAALDVALDAPISYRLRVDFDAPDVRCPPLTSAPSYVESSDGASNDGNDVYVVNGTSFAFTARTSDVPEATNLGIAAGSSYLLSGTAANVAQSGDYFDPDTYAIHTGPSTAQLTIRADWPGGSADFDYLANADATTLIGSGLDTASEDGRELHTFAVLPDTSYWLWIAPYENVPALPVSYDVTICGAELEF